MNKLTTFFHSFKNSVSNPFYFNDLLKAKFSFSFKYLLICAFLFSLASTAIFMYKVKPTVDEIVARAPSIIINTYPQDLVFHIQGGEWYINKKEPYVVPFPKFINDSELKDAGLPKNMITFYKNGTIDDVARLETMLLVNRKNILAMNENGGVDSSPIGEIPNTRITRQSVEKAVAEFVPVIERIVALSGIVVLVLFTLWNFFGLMLYLLWLGLLLWIMGIFFSRRVTYEKSYQFAIHTITIPLILKLFLSMVAFGMPLPFWFTVVAIIIAAFGFANLTLQSDQQGINTVEQP
jgi:hypothetical protein